MVRVILAAAVLLVAGEGRGRDIIIDDGQRHTFGPGDLDADDRLIIRDALIVRVEGAQFAAAEVFGRSQLNVFTGSVVNEIITHDNSRAIVGRDARAARVVAQNLDGSTGGFVTVRDRGVIDSLEIIGGTPQISIFAGSINSWSSDEAALIRLWVGGYLLSVVGSWEDDTAMVRGISTGSRVDDMPVEIPLSNEFQWSVNVLWTSGVLRDGDHFESSTNPALNTVDIEELNAVRNRFGSDTASRADVNYDGRVGMDDLNMVRNHFGNDGDWQWTPASSAAVPEPSSLLLSLIAAFALSTHRGRVPR